MKHVFLTLITLASLAGYGQQYNWTRQYKGSNYDTRGIQSLAEASGNVYVLSHYYFSYPHTDEVNGWMLQKYDKAGTLLWSPNTETDYIWTIAHDNSEHLYLSGLDSAGDYIAEIDRTGSINETGKPKDYLLCPGSAAGRSYCNMGNKSPM